MNDVEKVIKGLNACARTDGQYCGACPYTHEGDCVAVMSKDVLELLKSQSKKQVLSFNDGYAEGYKDKDKEIVRCKDCDNKECWGRAGDVVCGIDGTPHRPNWFCADGERKDGEHG